MDRRGVGGRKKIPGLFGRRVLAGFRRSGRSLDLVVAGFQAARVGASCADIAAELMHRFGHVVGAREQLCRDFNGHRFGRPPSLSRRMQTLLDI
jgi:hypothetical protein